MKKKLLAIITTAFVAVMAFALVGCGGNSDSGSSSSSSELRFVTGGESGTYYAYGTVLAQYATNNADTPVNALSSEGSKANIESLQHNEAELAFCQSDVATYAYEGTSLFEGAQYQDFSVVAALYGEQVQIVTCNPDIKTVADLKGKTVSIGAANSGVYFNAVDILKAYDMTESDINAVYQNFADSADSLKNDKIDAAFITAGAPTTAITDLCTSKQAYLVSMDAEHIAKLQEASPYYAASTIPAGTYNGMEADTQTVAVLAIVLANDSVDENAVYNFTKSLFEGAKNQPDAHAKYKELSLEEATSITSLPYSAGAAKYYAEQDVTVNTK
ncbi:MAG: TAXI family TRAP transporter solute-binding subunit [Eggerthellaceae bacterium]